MATARNRPKPEEFKIDRGSVPMTTTTLPQDVLLTAEGIYDTAKLAGQDGRIIGSKPVQKIAGYADKLNKIKAPQVIGNLAKGSRLAQAGSLLTPAGLYTVADLGVGFLNNKFRGDNRGLSEMGGNLIGSGIGKVMYGSGDGYGDNEGMRTLAQENERREAAGEPALSASESVQFLKSLNPREATPSANNTNSTTNSTMATSSNPSLTSNDLSGNPYASMVLGQQTATQGAEKAKTKENLDATGAVKDLDKSQEMQTLREENARRGAQGLPDLSAPESVEFLNAVNPETFKQRKQDNQPQQQLQTRAQLRTCRRHWPLLETSHLEEVQHPKELL